MDEIIKTIEALKINRFEVEYFKTGVEAKEVALKQIPQQSSVGFGGSVTVDDIGLFNALINGPYKIINPYEPGIEREESIERRRKGLAVDYFVTGTNAITSDGKLVNIDGFGNRVAAMIFGPKNVFIFTSVKKIVPNVHKAIERIKKIAAPLNCKRLNRQTACFYGKPCSECPPEASICNVTVILERAGMKNRVKIFLIEEDFGY